MARQALAGAKKKSRREGRTIVFIDESGLSERPTRVKTWAPKGQTPVLQYSFTWKQLSVIAGISFWNFYFRFHAGAIRGPQFVEFLQALTKQIRGKLLVIWDGLPAHRSRVVNDYVESLDGHLVLERLPAYAPELNPVEYIWGYMKQRELANLCLDTIGEVRHLRTQPAQVDATPTATHHRVLAAGRIADLTSCIYVRLNSIAVCCSACN